MAREDMTSHISDYDLDRLQRRLPPPPNPTVKPKGWNSCWPSLIATRGRPCDACRQLATCTEECDTFTRWTETGCGKWAANQRRFERQGGKWR